MNGVELLYFPRQSFSPRFGDHIFTVDITSHCKAMVVDNNCYGCGCIKREVILYKIIIKKGKKEWYIEKRFSEILSLLNKLKLTPKFHELNVIPTKTWFNMMDDDTFLNQREDNLLLCLDAALKDLSSQGSKALMTSEIMKFLLIYL